MLLAFLLGAAGPAFAHASLISAEPAEGSVLGAAPERFSLTFNEPVSPLVLKLVRADGAAIPLDRYALHDTRLDIEAPPGLGTGTAVLSWRVISEDGHPVGGSIVFSIGAPSAAPPPVMADTVGAPVRAAIWTARVAIYVALFLGRRRGFLHGLDERRCRAAVPALSASSVLLGLVAVPLSVGLQGLDALDLPLAGLTQGAVWRDRPRDELRHYGRRGAAGPAARAFVSGRPSGRHGEAAGTGGAAGRGRRASRRAAMRAPRAPQWLTRPAVFLHGIGIAVWAGALVPLGLLLGRRDAEARPALERFSRLIPFVLAPLVAAGVTLAAIQVETPSALLTTAYGRVFLVKLALVLTLLILAAVNRWRLTAPVQRGSRLAAGRLGRMIAVEAVLLLAILCTAALWRFTPPPRALLEAAAAPAELHIHTDKAMAQLSITPGRAGPVTVSIALATGDFQPLEAKEVSLALANPGAGIEPIRRAAQPCRPTAPGGSMASSFRWRAAGMPASTSSSRLRARDDRGLAAHPAVSGAASAPRGMPPLWAWRRWPGRRLRTALEQGLLVGALGDPVDERHDQGGHGIALPVQHRAADIGDADDVTAGVDLEPALADLAESPIKLVKVDLDARQRPALLDPAPGGCRRLE